MPIYEYICSKCQNEFEALVRGEEDLKCPKCGSGKLTKQWSVPAAHSSSDSLPCGTACGLERPAPT